MSHQKLARARRDTGTRPRVQVQAAGPGDVEGILHLWASARSPAATTADDSMAIGRLLAHAPGSLLVARQGREVVGTVIATWDGWRGHIYRLAVLPDHRLRGIGRRLVAAGEERLRHLGARTVNASVGEGDPGPVMFWRAVGYELDMGMRRFSSTVEIRT